MRIDKNGLVGTFDEILEFIFKEYGDMLSQETLDGNLLEDTSKLSPEFWDSLRKDLDKLIQKMTEKQEKEEDRRKTQRR